MKIKLDNISKIFVDREKRETRAVDKFNAEILDGQLIGLLGPSGCGKSTTLFMISGLYNPTEGNIFFGDEDVTELAPEKRGIGLVFQNYALYPHMTVRQNILFPLENLKVPKEEAEERAQNIADLVGIGNLMNRKPSQLSGGQQQRVAIARALVKKPKVLLLDEPLSNLDARLRLQMREEIKRIQRETKITTVFVTHDQEEAMSICDEIILMELGVQQQRGIPQDIYDNPKNLFVAKFLGTPPINLYNAKIKNNQLCIGDTEIVPASKLKNTETTWKDIKNNHPIVEKDNSELTIKIAGSETIKEPTLKALEEFSKKAGNFKFEFQLTGSTDAYLRTQGNKRDHKQFGSHLGISTRPLNDEERGVRRYIKKYLLDGACVIVNKNNPLNELTKEQLKLLANGKLNNWKKFKFENDEEFSNMVEALPKKESLINVYTLDNLSGIRANLIDYVNLRHHKNVFKKAKILLSTEEIIKNVVADKFGIGIVPFTKLTDEVKVLKIDGLLPTINNIKDRTYPLANQGVILGRTIDKTDEDKIAMAFLDYIKTKEGLKVLEDSGAILTEQEFVVGIRPEGYTINQRGKLKINVEYYESVGRDLSLVCNHPQAQTKTYRIILSDVKKVDKIKLDKPTSFSIKSDKMYIFEKESGKRVL